MSLPTTVRRLDVATLDIPLLEPFGIAQGAQMTAHNLLVTVELADGTRGYGEAAPFPAFNGETQASARSAIEVMRRAVEGADVREWGVLGILLRDAPGSARCAIETAIFDALTKRDGLSLWSFFGGAKKPGDTPRPDLATKLVTDITVTTGSIDHAKTAASAHARAGFRTLKIKVGGGSVEVDVARVEAVALAAPECAILLDANASMSARDATELVLRLHALGIKPSLFEQPVARDDHAGLADIKLRTGILLAADESVTSARDARTLAASRTVDVFNIKLMKTAIVESLEIAAIARAHGIGLMIGGMVESILAMSTSACFAAGIGGFTFVDLDTPMFLAENPFVGGFAQKGDELELGGIDAGHGVNPRATLGA